MRNDDLDITKELFELSDIDNNPKRPALDIESIEALNKDEVYLINNDVYSDNNINETLIKQEELVDTINEIDAIENTIEQIDELSDEVKDVKVKKKLKDKIKDKWNNMSKKKKIVFIVVSVLIFISIIVTGVILYKHFSKDEVVVEKEKTIFEADNYRFENGSLILFNKDKKQLGKYKCENNDEKLCYVAYTEMDETLDVGKKISEDGKLLSVRSNILKERYVFIHDSKEDEDAKLYDLKENKVIESYKGVKTYSSIESYAIVKDNEDNYGLIDLENDASIKIDFNYTNMAIIEDNKDEIVIVDEDGKNFLLNYSKKSLTKPVSEKIVAYNDKYIVCENEGKYSLYDYKGKNIYEDYDYIKIVDKYIALLKDNKLYIKDFEDHKYNIEGIDIKNNYKYYQKLFIYDKDNKYIDSYQAFDVAVNQTTITVTSNNKDTVLSLDEGRVSALTKYVDYFEKVLYFYKDEDKNELIGSYKCNNENFLDSSSNNFGSCFIASDKGSSDNDMSFVVSEGLIPIINEKYVFIKDNPSAVNEDNIVLYDLKANKSLGKFSAINTNLNTKTNDVNFINQNNIDIIAKNNKGNYGVISVNGNGNMSSLIPYNFDMIELVKDNFVVHNKDGYSLYNKNGNEICKKVAEKIRGYNSKYVKASNDSNYSIYDYEGKKITTQTYKYIELYDSYFAAVDSSNKLNIYSYSNPSEALLNDPITLNITKYYGEVGVAFKIEISASNATIHIFKDGGYLTQTNSLVKAPVSDPIPSTTDME